MDNQWDAVVPGYKLYPKDREGKVGLLYHIFLYQKEGLGIGMYSSEEKGVFSRSRYQRMEKYRYSPFHEFQVLIWYLDLGFFWGVGGIILILFSSFVSYLEYF